MNLSRIFIERPIMTVLVSFAILLFGTVAFRGLPVAALPSVDYPTISVTASLPYVAAQKVRGIALLAPQRHPKMPDLPTMTEAGLAGLGIESWIGLFAPSRTPAEVLARLRQETRIAAAELKDQFEKSGGTLMQIPVAATDKFIKSEFDLWTKVIRDAGIRLD